MLDFSVILPAHNESENLKVLLPKLCRALAGFNSEIIVVDNSSSDNTGDVARLLAEKCAIKIRVIDEPKLGYGRAILTGLKIAQGDYLGIMQSDNQIKVEDLVGLYLSCRTGGYRFYKAVRRSRVNDGLKRIIISKIYNILFRIFFGVTTRDVNAMPKIFARQFYNEAALESKDWFIDAEMVIKADQLGCKIGEGEIEFLPRLGGKSSVRWVHIFQFLRNMVIWHRKLTK